MAYQNTVLDLSLRIALYVANATMRTLGWDQTPELSVSSVVELESLSTGAVKYSIRYPLWEDPNRVNVVEVWIGRGQDGKWNPGQLEAYGWWQQERPHTNGYRQQAFHVTWAENGAPIIQLGTFMQLPESPPSLTKRKLTCGKHLNMAMTYGEGQAVAGEALAGELGMTAERFRNLMLTHGCEVHDEGPGMPGCFAVRATDVQSLFSEDDLL